MGVRPKHPCRLMAARAAQGRRPVPVPLSDAPHLRVPGAQRGRERHVGGQADGAPGLDDHRQEVRPVDSFDGPDAGAKAAAVWNPLTAPLPRSLLLDGSGD